MDAVLTLQRGMRDREVCSVAFRFEVWQRRIAELVEQRSVRVVESGFGGDVKRMRARNELAWAYVSWAAPPESRRRSRRAAQRESLDPAS
jgi:hypothetical protein